MSIANDRKCLRNLARRVKELSENGVMEERTRLWTSLNDLRCERPMVLVSPEGAWNEIYDEWQLECEESIAREFEIELRSRIYRHENICDDWVHDDKFYSPAFVKDNGFGVELKKEVSGFGRGAYKHVPPITDIDCELNKLHFRELSIDLELTQKRLELARDMFGDILDVSMHGEYFWSAGLTSTVIELIGLEQFMMYMYDQPKPLKRLMNFLGDEMKNYLLQLEDKGILSSNNTNELIGSGNWGLTNDLPEPIQIKGSPKLKHIWGLCESQETIGVSPEMFGEFIFPYQKPLMELFGLSYYGCCEPVEERFEYIKQVNNLRCISVSPWSNIEKCAQLYGNDYVLCVKVNPGNICVKFMEDAIRKEVRNILDIARGLNIMFILKDTHTIGNEPERFRKWVEIVRREIEIKI